MTKQPSIDFIRAIINNDLKANKNDGRVATRFPPEPNGYLHIGHAKSICLNFGMAREFGGVCHMRFDDTNPTKEETEYVESIQEDIRWLGFDWDDREYYASDYFEQLYNFRPTEEWLDKVQKSALKFGNGCSASFISEDGLIMTNHHCIRGILRDMSTYKEDLLKYRFYADSLNDEKKIPNLFVNQLMMIENVKEEIKLIIKKIILIHMEITITLLFSIQ